MSGELRCPEWAEDSARPIVFANDVEEFPYSAGGTCFLFSFDGRRYVATASHCMKGRAGEELQVHASTKFDDFSLPLMRQISPEGGADPLPHASDVVVFRVDEQLATDAQRAACDAFQLERWSPLILHEADPLLVVGFPSRKREINYEEFWFRNQRVIAEGSYIEGRADARLHWMTLGVPGLDHPDGFSGSPVFALKWAGRQCAVRCFSGIVIRSTTVEQPWNVQYVCGSVLQAIVRADGATLTAG